MILPSGESITIQRTALGCIFSYNDDGGVEGTFHACSDEDALALLAAIQSFILETESLDGDLS
jgi:hypothetical protein